MYSVVGMIYLAILQWSSSTCLSLGWLNFGAMYMYVCNNR